MTSYLAQKCTIKSSDLQLPHKSFLIVFYIPTTKVKVNIFHFRCLFSRREKICLFHFSPTWVGLACVLIVNLITAAVVLLCFTRSAGTFNACGVYAVYFEASRTHAHNTQPPPPPFFLKKARKKRPSIKVVKVTRCSRVARLLILLSLSLRLRRQIGDEQS